MIAPRPWNLSLRDPLGSHPEVVPDPLAACSALVPGAPAASLVAATVLVTLTLTCLSPSVARAQGTDAGISRAEEIALAESAGPPALVADATIYARGVRGYEVAREGTNGASCLVSQDRPDTLEPLCFDAEGTRALLPVYLERGKWRAEGLSEEEITARIQDGFDSGRFGPPAKTGVSYMLSESNRVFNGSEVITYPPHIMVYAPYLTNADIGADMSDPYMPWVLEEGSPHAYIIVVVGGR